MALSLSPHQFKQAIHTPPISNSLLHPSRHSATPRRFRPNVHDMPDNKTLSINQTDSDASEPDPLLLTSTTSSEHVTGTHNDVNKVTSASRGESADLPSWTPLKTSGHDEGPVISDNEVDELSTGNATRSPMKRPREPPTLNGRATIETAATRTATGILKLKPPSADAKPASNRKKARFDGILITTKPPSHKKHSSRPGSFAPVSSSRTQQLSLVDALARTFNANKHAVLSRRHSRTALVKDDGGSATPGPQTDAETTEAEDEQLQLNTRLAHSPSKRAYPRARAIVSENVSENDSEGVASLLPQREAERPVKRFKAIAYDANAGLIDAALETVTAPLGWDAELDLITREDDDFALPMTQNAPAAPHGTEEDIQMVADQGTGDPTSGPTAGKVLLPSPIPVAANEWHGPTRVTPRQSGIFLPYLSRGAKFMQRLDTIYGENATVRTDRVARPRPVDLDLYAPFDDLDNNPRESSPSPSESPASVSAASALNEGVSAVPSTHITSQSPSDVPSADIVADDINLEQLSRNKLSEVVTGSTQPAFDIDEEAMGGWIVALQRLVKGKIRISEEDLGTVSVILAEIESVKDNLDESVSMTSELRESVRQLSELHEIPFGDRNKLRQHAEVIFHTWPSVKKLGAS